MPRDGHLGSDSNQPPTTRMFVLDDRRREGPYRQWIEETTNKCRRFEAGGRAGQREGLIAYAYPLSILFLDAAS